jgi:FkbM family methyltransferase
MANQLSKHGLLPRKPGELRTVGTFHLPQFTVVNGEGVSEQIASYGIYEENLTAAFLCLVKSGDVVVDIGMHLGYYTTLFAILVGEKGEVHGFEPTPSTRLTAQINVGRFPQVRVYPHAVWSSRKILTVHDYGPQWLAFNSFTGPRMDQLDVEPKTFEVGTISLDELQKSLSRPISLVKIDAESAEREIISGAEDLLTSNGPIISVEVGDFDNQPSSRALVEFLSEMGYAAWEYHRPAFTRHQPKETYCYDNLIFAPASQDLSVL